MPCAGNCIVRERLLRLILPSSHNGLNGLKRRAHAEIFMNPERSKLKQQETSLEQSHSLGGQSSREFASVEELLRHDAAQTVPPPELAARVNASEQLLH